MGNKVKRTALAALVGSAAIFGGCLGNGMLGRVLWDAAIYTGLEWATDNDGGLVDLWEDGEPTPAAAE